MPDPTNPVPVPQVELHPVAESAPPKPGWKSSEFWLKIAAFALTAAFASGVIPTSGPVAQVVAIAATMLGALGYTVSRTLVKNASMYVVLLMLAGGTLIQASACGATSKAAGRAAIADVVDCTTPDRVRLEAQFGPTMEQAIQRATGLDGKVDLPSLDAIGRSLEADGWCVLEHAAGQLIAAAFKRIPGSPAAADAPLDAKDLAVKVAAFRAAKFGEKRFEFAKAAP